VKRILGLLTAILLVSPVIAGEVVTSDGGGRAWVVMGGDIHFCRPLADGEVLCKKARIEDAVIPDYVWIRSDSCIRKERHEVGGLIKYSSLKNCKAGKRE